MAKRKRSPKRYSLLPRLRKHLSGDPALMPVLEQDLAVYERPNLHLAIEELIKDLADPRELIGIVAQNSYESPRLAKLSRASTTRYYETGPVEYIDLPLADGRQLACVKCGLYLLRDADGPIALLLT